MESQFERTPAQQLFDAAYKLHVLENDTVGAVAKLRKALELDPTYFEAQVLLGTYLDEDESGEEEVRESRELFLTALRSAPSARQFSSGWPEEQAIYHLGVWEARRQNYERAMMLYLIEFLVSGTSWARADLLRLLERVDPEFRADINLILLRLYHEFGTLYSTRETTQAEREAETQELERQDKERHTSRKLRRSRRRKF